MQQQLRKGEPDARASADPVINAARPDSGKVTDREATHSATRTSLVRSGPISGSARLRSKTR
jgi:hypothetical protein